MKARQEASLGLYVAIILYGLLPRFTVHIDFLNYFSLSRTSTVLLVTIGMLVIAYQKTEKGKWERLDLRLMVLSAYILSILFSIIQFVPTAFL